MSPEEEKVLHQRLIQLGDMMGDGLHYERDGQWITREYKATLRALGLLKAPKRKHNPTKTLADGATGNTICRPRCEPACAGSDALWAHVGHAFPGAGHARVAGQGHAHPQRAAKC